MYGSNWACSAAGAWGTFCEWPFLGLDSFLLYSVEWYVQHYLDTRRPRFSLAVVSYEFMILARLRFSPAPEKSLIDHTQQL